MLKKYLYLFVFLLVSFFLYSCNQGYTPKPSGYFRIDFPEKKYQKYNGVLPYSFEYPIYGSIKSDTARNAEPYWINIEFPSYRGKIHISYKQIKGNLPEYIEDARKLAYRHTVKADAIDEKLLSYKLKNVYGILYDIKGNAASSVQFFLTDSIRNFLRGALYISSQPNKDSLAPVIDFFKKDIDHFIETFEWKNKKAEVNESKKMK